MVTQSEMEHARYETQRKAQMDAVWQANEIKRMKEWQSRAGELELQLEAGRRELESNQRELESNQRELESSQRELARLNQELESQRKRAELMGKAIALRDVLNRPEPSEQTLQAATQQDLDSFLADLKSQVRVS